MVKELCRASWMDEVLSELRQVRGIDLSGYRRNMLERRIAARMARAQIDDAEAYLRKLQTDPSECSRLIDAILINVSSFFRDPIVFEIIAQSVLPAIIADKREQQSREIRVWCAGCAAGEEPYSIAILIREALKGEGPRWAPHIFATDIDFGALERLASAAFPRESLGSTKLDVLDTYFVPKGDGYEVCPLIREMVHFSRDDLTSRATVAPAESIFGGFDLVLCRNLLIYLSLDLQAWVCRKLHRSLRRGGYLILGDAELLCVGVAGRFDILDSRNRIFRNRG